MRVPLSVVLLAVCIWAAADDGVPVDSVVAAVRTSIAKKRKDAVTAAALDQVQLAQHLEDRVIEILESEGAGPQTLGALQRLRDASRFLPAPPDPPKGMMPPPPPSAGEESQAWQNATDKARDYIHTLPDFICSETIYRWADPTGNEKWQPAPTVVADLTFFDRQEHYQVKTVDGKPSDKSLPELNGAISAGEFGSMMATIFKPDSETERRWDHWTVLRKRPASVFFFRIAASHHPHELWYRTGPGKMIKTVVGLHGYVYLDPENGSVTRISTIVEDIPAAFPVQRSNTVLDYDYADVGGTLYLLPMRAEVRMDAGELQSLNAVEFHKYRKFGADTSVSFGKDGK
jgi:hypothetical protein